VPDIHSRLCSNIVGRIYEVGRKSDELLHEIERKKKGKEDIVYNFEEGRTADRLPAIDRVIT